MLSTRAKRTLAARFQLKMSTTLVSYLLTEVPGRESANLTLLDCDISEYRRLLDALFAELESEQTVDFMALGLAAQT